MESPHLPDKRKNRRPKKASRQPPPGAGPSATQPSNKPSTPGSYNTFSSSKRSKSFRPIPADATVGPSGAALDALVCTLDAAQIMYQRRDKYRHIGPIGKHMVRLSPYARWKLMYMYVDRFVKGFSYRDEGRNWMHDSFLALGIPDAIATFFAAHRINLAKEEPTEPCFVIKGLYHVVEFLGFVEKGRLTRGRSIAVLGRQAFLNAAYENYLLQLNKLAQDKEAMKLAIKDEHIDEVFGYIPHDLLLKLHGASFKERARLLYEFVPEEPDDEIEYWRDIYYYLFVSPETSCILKQRDWTRKDPSSYLPITFPGEEEDPDIRYFRRSIPDGTKEGERFCRREVGQIIKSYWKRIAPLYA